MTLPPIKIIATTYLPPGNDGNKRLVAFEQAVASWCELEYEGDIRLMTCDDGSEINLQDHLMNRYAIGKQTMYPWGYSQEQRHGVGASFNRGIFQAKEDNSLVLYLVDDWELLQPFDLTPWAQLLMDEPSIGMVRLGPPHPWLTGQIIHHPACDWYMKLDRHHFAFAHRPALYHQRFFDTYGPFAEGINAYECEQQYNDHFCKIKGPDIVLALPHPWRHIESIELEGVVPG